MTVFIGADHRGFELKTKLLEWLKEKGYEAVDCGNSVYDKDDDYPDYAKAVAGKVAESPDTARGIVICGSGIGVCIAANKVDGVRCALGFDKKQTYYGRTDDDVNVLAIPAEYVGLQTVYEVVETFLTTPASDESRHRRRQRKVAEMEK